MTISFKHINTISVFNNTKFSADSTDSTYYLGDSTTLLQGTPNVKYTDVCLCKANGVFYSHGRFYYTSTKDTGIRQVSDLNNYNAVSGEIVQYIGQTTNKYTHGYFYKASTEEINIPSGEAYIYIPENDYEIESGYYLASTTINNQSNTCQYENLYPIDDENNIDRSSNEYLATNIYKDNTFIYKKINGISVKINIASTENVESGSIRKIYTLPDSSRLAKLSGNNTTVRMNSYTKVDNDNTVILGVIADGDFVVISKIGKLEERPNGTFQEILDVVDLKTSSGPFTKNTWEQVNVQPPTPIPDNIDCSSINTNTIIANNSTLGTITDINNLTDQLPIATKLTNGLMSAIDKKKLDDNGFIGVFDSGNIEDIINYCTLELQKKSGYFYINLETTTGSKPSNTGAMFVQYWSFTWQTGCICLYAHKTHTNTVYRGYMENNVLTWQPF